MNTLLSLARGVGRTVAFIGGCLLLYPVFSLQARFGGRGLGRVFAGTYVVTGSLLHLPLLLFLGFGVVTAGFHIPGWADYRETTTLDSSEDAR